MNWEKTFKSQDYGRPIYKHMDLPVYITDEFDFYRCVEFNTSFYGKTASTLFKGNLSRTQQENQHGENSGKDDKIANLRNRKDSEAEL